MYNLPIELKNEIYKYINFHCSYCNRKIKLNNILNKNYVSCSNIVYCNHKCFSDFFLFA